MMTPRFLAAAALALALAACSSPRPPWADGAVVTERAPSSFRQDLSGFPARILAIHNAERQRAGVAPLVWDARLAAGAEAYARELATTGPLRHSSRESRPGQGENLWMGTRGAYSPEDMVGSWAGERSYFRPGIFPNVSTSGNWSDVAHYTQMIWRGTTAVGCAIGRSPGTDYLVCRYTPAGNVTGQRVP